LPIVGQLADAMFGDSLRPLLWVLIVGGIVITGTYIVMQMEAVPVFCNVVAAGLHFGTILMESVVVTVKVVVEITCKHDCKKK